jgi:hypothetical protein
MIVQAQTTKTYTADNTTNFANPERGFHTTYNPPWPTSGTVAAWEASTNSWTKQLDENWVRNNRIKYGISLHSMRYSLSMFRNSALSTAFLDRITEDLARARRARIKLIVRFVYTWCGCTADATSSMIVSHLQQLKPVLEANKDVLAWLDAGFVGCWGEWHSSSNGLLSGTYGDNINADSRAIVDALFVNIPVNRNITFRYPRQNSQYFHPTAPDAWEDYTPMPSSSEAYNGSNISRLGNLNDSYRSDVAGGTYGYEGNNTLITNLMNRVSTENQYVVQSGEMDLGLGDTQNRVDCTSSFNEFRDMHYTAFNHDEGNGGFTETLGVANTMTKWRNDGCYNSIARGFGYRFRLTSVMSIYNCRI